MSEIDAFFREQSMILNCDRRRADLLDLLDAGLPEGCIAEIGCHRAGLLAYLACRYPDRWCYGLDRFDDGFKALHPVYDPVPDSSYREGGCASSFEEVSRYIERSTQLYGGRIQLFKGDVGDGIDKLIEPIALAIVDTNLYEPTKVSLDATWLRMVSGGVIVVDDVGFKGVDAALSHTNLQFERKHFFAIIRK